MLIFVVFVCLFFNVQQRIE